MGQYTYDAFNRRTSKKTFEEVQQNQGEYQPDANTLALYHFNETTGPVLDASGNGNHGKAHKHIKRGVEGLFNTKAIQFQGVPVIFKSSPSLNNLTDKLTVETWVYLKGKQCENKREHHRHWHWHKGHWFCQHCWERKFHRGSLIEKPGNYELEIGRERKATFTLAVEKFNRPRRATVYSNDPIPVNQWVHLAAVYDGSKIKLYVNGIQQADDKPITGEVKTSDSPLLLGCEGFRGKLEEARISNVARTSFGGNGGTATKVTLRTIFYSGWRLIEERERTGILGQTLSAEKVTRTFVDGGNIDEHLCQDVYDAVGNGVAQTSWSCENARGDTVALTDASGNVTLRLCYAAYGEAYKVASDGTLEALADGDAIAYLFQGRQLDEETGLLYYRNRFYSASQGRFLTRDTIKSDLYLYEAFYDSPYRYSDPLGLQQYTSSKVQGKDVAFQLQGREIKPAENQDNPGRLTYEFIIEAQKYACPAGSQLDYIQFVANKAVFTSTAPAIGKQQFGSYPTRIDHPTRTKQEAEKQRTDLEDNFPGMFSEEAKLEQASIDPTYRGVIDGKLGDSPGLRVNNNTFPSPAAAAGYGLRKDIFTFTTCAVCVACENGNMLVRKYLGCISFTVTIDYEAQAANSNITTVSDVINISQYLKNMVDNFYLGKK